MPEFRSERVKWGILSAAALLQHACGSIETSPPPSMPEGGTYDVTFFIDQNAAGSPGSVAELPAELMGEHSLKLDVRYDPYDVPVGYFSDENPSATLVESRLVRGGDTLVGYLTDVPPLYLASNVLSWRHETEAGWRVTMWPAQRGPIAYDVRVEIERKSWEAELARVCQLSVGFRSWTPTACGVTYVR